MLHKMHTLPIIDENKQKEINTIMTIATNIGFRLSETINKLRDKIKQTITEKTIGECTYETKKNMGYFHLP